MDFVAVVDQVITLLRLRGRVTHRTIQRQFQLDEDALAHLLAEKILTSRSALEGERKQVTVLFADLLRLCRRTVRSYSWTPCSGGAAPWRR